MQEGDGRRVDDRHRRSAFSWRWIYGSSSHFGNHSLLSPLLPPVVSATEVLPLLVHMDLFHFHRFCSVVFVNYRYVFCVSPHVSRASQRKSRNIWCLIHSCIRLPIPKLLPDAPTNHPAPVVWLFGSTLVFYGSLRLSAHTSVPFGCVTIRSSGTFVPKC